MRGQAGEDVPQQGPQGRDAGADDAAVELDDRPVRCRDVVPRRVVRVDGAAQGEEADDGDDAGAIVRQATLLAHTLHIEWWGLGE